VPASDEREDVTDIKVTIEDVLEPADAEPATIEPRTAVRRAIDSEPSVIVRDDPTTQVALNRRVQSEYEDLHTSDISVVSIVTLAPVPAESDPASITLEPHKAAPAESEPSSITLEPNMSVRTIDAGTIARMQETLARGSEANEEDPTSQRFVPAKQPVDEDGDSISIEPKPVRSKSRKMTLVGVGDRGPPLPAAGRPATVREPVPATEPAVTRPAATQPARTVKDTMPELETEKRRPMMLEQPITLSEEIPIPQRIQRDTDAMAPQSPPRPGPVSVKAPLPAAGNAPSPGGGLKVETPTPPMRVPPSIPSRLQKQTELLVGPNSVRARAAAAAAQAAAAATQSQPPPPPQTNDADESSPRSYRNVFSSAPSDAPSPHVRRTAVALAASFVLAGAAASGFVIWQASKSGNHDATTTAPAQSQAATPPPPASNDDPGQDPPPQSTIASKSTPPGATNRRNGPRTPRVPRSTPKQNSSQPDRPPPPKAKFDPSGI
jgi:hypothetical protein